MASPDPPGVPGTNLHCGDTCLATEGRQPLVDVPPSKRHPLGVSLTSTKRRQPPKRHPLGASSLKWSPRLRGYHCLLRSCGFAAGTWRHLPLVLGDIFRWFLGASSAGSWRHLPLVLGDIFRWSLATSSAGSWRYFPLVLGGIVRWFLALSRSSAVPFISAVPAVHVILFQYCSPPLGDGGALFE